MMTIWWYDDDDDDMMMMSKAMATLSPLRSSACSLSFCLYSASASNSLQGKLTFTKKSLTKKSLTKDKFHKDGFDKRKFNKEKSFKKERGWVFLTWNLPLLSSQVRPSAIPWKNKISEHTISTNYTILNSDIQCKIWWFHPINFFGG